MNLLGQKDGMPKMHTLKKQQGCENKRRHPYSNQFLALNMCNAPVKAVNIPFDFIPSRKHHGAARIVMRKCPSYEILDQYKMILEVQNE